MSSEIKDVVAEIGSLIRTHPWFDFHVYKFQNSDLIIAGNTDLTYSHSIEIIFQRVFFFSGYFQEWRSDTRKPVFEVPENARELSLHYKIEYAWWLERVFFAVGDWCCFFSNRMH